MLIVLLLSRLTSCKCPSVPWFVEEEEEEEETPGGDGLGEEEDGEALGSLAPPPRWGVESALFVE